MLSEVDCDVGVVGCVDVAGIDCVEVRVLDAWMEDDEAICGTGDLDIESIGKDDSREPSGKVDPTPSVKIFDGVVQQSAPLPVSQQNCPKEGSPHWNKSTFPSSLTITDLSILFKL